MVALAGVPVRGVLRSRVFWSRSEGVSGVCVLNGWDSQGENNVACFLLSFERSKFLRGISL